MLAHQLSGSGPAVVLLHGFGQDRTCWWGLAEPLASSRTVVAVDLPGHGETGLGAALPEAEPTAAAVVELCAALGLERPVLVGYSMGARIALRAALRSTGTVHGIALIGGTAGPRGPVEAAERRLRDSGLADWIERDGAEAFARRWEREPVLSGQPPELVARQRAVRAAQDARALAAALRGLGPAGAPALWDRLPDVRVPALLVAGARDRRYRRLAVRMATRMPNARTAVVADAGHAAHLEQPHALLELLAHAGPSGR